MNSILIWLVAALFGFGSTAGGSSASAESTPSPAPAESLQAAVEPSAGVEERFAEREMLPPCGMLDVTAHSPGVDRTRMSPPRQAWTCLQEALGRGGTELVTLDRRRDGTTVHTFYRATRDGRLEIWTQRTRSTPGRLASRWAYDECTPSTDLRRQPCAS